MPQRYLEPATYFSFPRTATVEATLSIHLAHRVSRSVMLRKVQLRAASSAFAKRSPSKSSCRRTTAVLFCRTRRSLPWLSPFIFSRRPHRPPVHAKGIDAFSRLVSRSRPRPRPCKELKFSPNRADEKRLRPDT